MKSSNESKNNETISEDKMSLIVQSPYFDGAKSREKLLPRSWNSTKQVSLETIEVVIKERVDTIQSNSSHVEFSVEQYVTVATEVS